MVSTFDETEIQYLNLKDFTFEDGTTLSSVRLAYQEFNPTGQKVALIPTCFLGRIKDTMHFTNGALRNHRVIVVGLLGGGESASPSNTPDFPSQIDYRDCVRAQYELIKDHLQIDFLDVVLGFSMAGQNAYYWLALYPQMIHNAIIICSAAKTSLYNYQLLEGPKHALLSSVDYNTSFQSLGTQPIRGLHAFAQAFSACVASAEWFEERMFEKCGHKTLGDWAAAEEKDLDDWHPHDLLAMLGMWQRADISAVVRGTSNSTLSIEEYLCTLNNRVLLMPCRTDQYFRWEASEREASYLQNGELVVIPSIWGHMAGGGSNQTDDEWMDDRIDKFLNHDVSGPATD
ncbi:hypothetical protein N7476_007593 [Penicillium atrosanguineum]|uniref:AB hydrolase-1 domain-containing protein n=1 Tax=Penicillium atrosanguineum TaxID=1132637 RepID=A0A9W9PW27_9EURO|nr:hypothetical protein N7476_007593 [Penicillium atrosanguineum]